MRIAVFLIAAAQIAYFVFAALTQTAGSDAAGNAMSQGFVTLAGIVMGIFLVPALVLAINRKALGVALILSLVPPAVAALWLS